MPSYGGFWRRFVAFLIDTIVLNIVFYIIMAIIGFGGPAQFMQIDANGEAALGTGYWTFLGISLVLQWLYFAILESSEWQGTLGKRALGMSVTDLDGRRISFGRATGRYFAKIISGLILLIGYLMIAFTERKQGLHDMIASTLIFKASPSDLVNTNAEVFS